MQAQQLAEWCKHPVTRLLFLKLKEHRNEVSENILTGKIGLDKDIAISLLNRSVGQAMVIDKVLSNDLIKDELLEDID